MLVVDQVSDHLTSCLTYALSFSPEFFSGDGSVELDELRVSRRPTNVAQAIISLSQETWSALAEQAFGVNPSQLDLSAVLRKIEETNTCLNLDSPVEIFIDAEGDFTVLVYDQATRDKSANERK